jgi:hypothetical protein
VAPYSSSPLIAWEQDCAEGFQGRLARRSQLPVSYPIGQTAPERSSTTSRRTNRSVAYEESMSPSSTVPSLSHGSTSTTSYRSFSTGMAIEGKHRLEDDGMGNLVPSTVIPSSSRTRFIYQCLFHTLKCEERFDAVDPWRTHVLSHFRSKPSPLDARCPFCQHRFSDARQGKAWNDLLNHVAQKHFERGATISNSRPDFELMEHLFKLKIITAGQFKNVQLLPSRSNPTYPQSHGSGIGTRDEPCFDLFNPNRERRERERRRGVIA